MSIDPIGCVDIDDACSLREIDGFYEVGIHIADVCHYLALDSALDRLARERATSVYLVDRRIDMLPASLSTNVCSLRAKHDRLAVSIFLTFDPRPFPAVFSPPDTLDLVKPPRCTRTVLRSRYSLAYPQAQALADQKPVPLIENPYPNPDSPYEYTGSPVQEADSRWLSHDIALLMRSNRGNGEIEGSRSRFASASSRERRDRAGNTRSRPKCVCLERVAAVFERAERRNRGERVRPSRNPRNYRGIDGRRQLDRRSNQRSALPFLRVASKARASSRDQAPLSEGPLRVSADPRGHAVQSDDCGEHSEGPRDSGRGAARHAHDFLPKVALSGGFDAQLDE